MSTISPKNIAQAIHSATEGKSGAALELAIKRSVQILKARRMIGKSDEVLSALQDIIDKETGTVRMKVVTARPIQDGERKKIENEVKEKYKAKMVVSEFFEKADLLGGIRIEVGDEVLDNTYRTKLENLENFLMQEK